MPMPETMVPWTLEELDRLPEDGNRYELVRGELFVTPPPSVGHESSCAVLSAILQPYVQKENLGRVFHPHAVVRSAGSQVEPDLMVRPLSATTFERWEDQPLPILVVEVLSGTTRQRDHGPKRDFYMSEGVPEYWIVDRWDRTIRVVRAAEDDRVLADTLTWNPAGATEPLVIDVADYFRLALGA